MSTNEVKPDRRSKFEIIGLEELPIEFITRNPRNPRPEFHLSDDDPELIALGASIATDGLHRPVLVYEQVGHYEMPDDPGHFVLLQGERRWSASKLEGLTTLKSNIHRAPESLTEELELLGIEEAHKKPWQGFFDMKHAYNLAQANGISVNSADIQNKTGLNRDQLRIADRLFRLEPKVQDMVAEYERMMYYQHLKGERRYTGRLAGPRVIRDKVRVGEFTPRKAALVYDIFEDLRSKLTLVVQDYSDEELQLTIASWATNGTSSDDLERLHSSIANSGDNPPPGTISKIHNLLENPGAEVKTVVNQLGNSKITKLVKIAKRCDALSREAVAIWRQTDQFGQDIGLLTQIHSTVVKTLRDLDRLERALDGRIKQVNNG